AFDNDQMRRIMPAGGTQRDAHGAQSVRARSSSVKRTGVALAGGGPLGGIYEVGALLALADSLEGFDLNALDVYVGVPSCSFVAAFLARLFSAAGRTNDFRQLHCKLFLVATNLDSGVSVTFGANGTDHVPISRAIEASSALPGMFPPVEIDGEHYVDGALNKTLHASVALDEGIDLLLCINPLVPFDASSASRTRRLTVEKIDRGGLPLVLSQTFRAIIHSRMKVGMEKYARQYPNADVLLFEPDRENADMFF